MSAAATRTEWPCSESRFASLPIVVVLPVPLTPTTRMTLGLLLDMEDPRLAEQRLDLLGERGAELAEVGPRLEPPDELGGRRHADVGGDQRLLEPLPRLLVARVERGRGELLGERAARLPERVAQTREEARPLVLRLRRRVLLAEEL